MNDRPETISRARKFAREWSMNVSVILSVSLLASSPYSIPKVIETVRAIGTNTEAVVTNSTAIFELTELLGDMGQLFGNGEISDVGDVMTAQINIHSDAVRFKPGQRIVVTNTGDRREMSATVEVAGKFESEPHIFLILTRGAGRALGAQPGETIQIMIVPEK